MPYRTLFLLLMLPLLARAQFQRDTVWVNGIDEVVAQRKGAVYYRTATAAADDTTLFTYYHPDGRLASQWYSPNGNLSVREGRLVQYDSLGHRSDQGFLSRGMRHGSWTSYFANSGRVACRITYEKDRRTGPCVWYDSLSGKPQITGQLVNGLREGRWATYYRGSDQILLEADYQSNERHGLRKGYYPDGRLRREEWYEHGKMKTGRVLDPQGRPARFVIQSQQAEVDLSRLSESVRRALRDNKHLLDRSLPGRLRLQFQVTAEGRVRDLVVLESLRPAIDRAYRTAVLQVRWRPGIWEGQPVASLVVLTLAGNSSRPVLETRLLHGQPNVP